MLLAPGFRGQRSTTTLIEYLLQTVFLLIDVQADFLAGVVKQEVFCHAINSVRVVSRRFLGCDSSLGHCDFFLLLLCGIKFLSLCQAEHWHDITCLRPLEFDHFPFVKHGGGITDARYFT